jgi:hypothetical protein
MSDRATLFGLAFGAAVLVDACLGLLADEAARENESPAAHEPQLSAIHHIGEHT